jgi:hypothetical protein
MVDDEEGHTCHFWQHAADILTGVGDDANTNTEG